MSQFLPPPACGGSARRRRTEAVLSAGFPPCVSAPTYAFASGKISRPQEGQQLLHRLIANGEVIAETSDTVGDAKAQFNFAYRSVDNAYPGSGPGSYAVVRGDTL